MLFGGDDEVSEDFVICKICNRELMILKYFLCFYIFCEVCLNIYVKVFK